MGKSTISMAMFNSYVSHNQRVHVGNYHDPWKGHPYRINQLAEKPAFQDINVSYFGVGMITIPNHSSYAQVLGIVYHIYMDV